MPRLKARKECHHEPNTHEYFSCLSDMIEYSILLLDNSPEKAYSEFLRWLIKMNFFNDRNEKISIKKIAADFGSDAGKITKWLPEIYKDVFELNHERPELFQKAGIKVSLIFRHHDDFCSFYLSLPAIPRQYERFQMHFVKARTGTNIFWVNDVQYLLEENNFEIVINLEGGFLNRYRELLVDKALFQEKIGFMEIFREDTHELDKKLKSIYRN